MKIINNNFILSIKDTKNHRKTCYNLELFFNINQDTIRRNGYKIDLTLKDLKDFGVDTNSIRNRDLEYSLNNLNGSTYKIKNLIGQKKDLGFVKSFSYKDNKRKRTYTIHFHKKIFSYLRTKSNYTRFNLNNALTLNKISYSRGLYLLLSKFQSYKGTFVTKFDDLKYVLGIQHSFKFPCNFVSKSLPKAIKEINEKTDLNVKFHSDKFKKREKKHLIYFKISKKFNMYHENKSKIKDDTKIPNDVSNSLINIGYKLHNKGKSKIISYIRKYGRECLLFAINKLSEEFDKEWQARMLDSKLPKYAYMYERKIIREKSFKKNIQIENERYKKDKVRDKTNKAYKKFSLTDKYKKIFNEIKERNKELKYDCLIDLKVYSIFMDKIYKNSS